MLWGVGFAIVAAIFGWRFYKAHQKQTDERRDAEFQRSIKKWLKEN